MGYTYNDLVAMMGEEKAKALWLEPSPSVKSKYRNEKVSLDGKKFDSKAERDYYSSLLLLKRAGEVIDFKMQEEFVLQDGFLRGKKKYRPIKYRADFVVKYKDRTEVVDVKGFETQIYKMKRKMFLSRYPESVFVEIRKGERKVW